MDVFHKSTGTRSKLCHFPILNDERLRMAQQARRDIPFPPGSEASVWLWSIARCTTSHAGIRRRPVCSYRLLSNINFFNTFKVLQYILNINVTFKNPETPQAKSNLSKTLSCHSPDLIPKNSVYSQKNCNCWEIRPRCGTLVVTGWDGGSALCFTWQFHQRALSFRAQIIFKVHTSSN